MGRLNASITEPVAGQAPARERVAGVAIVAPPADLSPALPGESGLDTDSGLSAGIGERRDDRGRSAGPRGGRSAGPRGGPRDAGPGGRGGQPISQPGGPRGAGPRAGEPGRAFAANGSGPVDSPSMAASGPAGGHGPAVGNVPAGALASGDVPGSGAPVGPALNPMGGPRPGSGCTAPQLKRFIKSRVYVPMHELRRRFLIEGGDDDVTPVRMGAGHIFVGLPEREGRLLGELLRGGDVGYELSMDPPTPIVVGLYPMRPISRS